MWLTRTGVPWADLPERFGKPNSVCRRFRRLAQKGVWEALFEALAAPEREWVVLDSTSLRVHQHSVGQKKAPPEAECLGRSRGRRSPTIHACTDALGNAVRLLATAGQAGDCPQTLPLLKDVQPGKVLADSAYDSDATRAYCAEHGIEAVIPSHSSRLKPAEMDEETYRDRQENRTLF